MTAFQVTLKLYLTVARQTGRAALRNWRLALATPVYLVAMDLASTVAAPLGGRLGGLVVGLVQAACFSLYLHLLDQAVREGGKVVWSDFGRGFGRYFWIVIRVLFLFWIVSLILGPTFNSPNGAVIFFLLGLVVSVALNALPEVLYQRGTTSFEALGQTVNFIQQNWIEWFAPVVVAGWFIAMLDPWIFAGAGLGSDLGTWVTVLNPLRQIEVVASRLWFLRAGSPVGGALAVVSTVAFYVLMIYRGLLFRALDTHSLRTRVYRHRMGLD